MRRYLAARNSGLGAGGEPNVSLPALGWGRAVAEAPYTLWTPRVLDWQNWAGVRVGGRRQPCRTIRPYAWHPVVQARACVIQSHWHCQSAASTAQLSAFI